MNLINTKMPAPRQTEMLMSGLASADYYYGRPYPRHAFGPHQWPPDKGPIPTALPYVGSIIDEGAEFVFKNGSPTFSVAGDDTSTEFLQEVIAANNLDAQWVSLAQHAANQGAIAVKFSYDESKPCPIRITFLDIPTECRVWIDPHDATNMLMARVQYPFRSTEDGDWYYFREEWTDDEYVTYRPLLAGAGSVSDPMMLPGYLDHLGDEGEWEIDQREPNPLGLIPITVIRNRVIKGNPLGEGDCWRVLRIVDRLALTMHGEDSANQLHSKPVTAFINAIPDNVGPLAPGEPMSVMQAEGSSGQPDVKMLTWDGSAREYTHKDIDKWEQLLYKAVGLSLVDPESVSNKGSLSEQVLRLLYQRTIATTDHKREMWGNSGMCVFLRNILLGLSRITADRRLAAISESTVVDCVWPDYFEPTDSDLSTTTDRTVSQVDNDLLTHEKAIERIGKAEKLSNEEIKLMKSVLLSQKKAKMLAMLPQNGQSTDLSEVADVESASSYNNFTS